MKSRWISLVVFLLLTAIFFSLAPQSVHFFGGPSAWGDEDKLPFPKDATFTTRITTPRAIEGLTGDNQRNLYTGGSGTSPCPVWQINLDNPVLTEVGSVVSTQPPPPATPACNFAGIAFDEAGNLYVADLAAATIYFFSPNAKNPPIAAIFALGVPGANGLAFDKKGNLWASDGTTGQGRVWKITGPGANCSTPVVNCEEVFRIQPMSNTANLDANNVGGVGRDVRTLPPGTILVTETTRNAANTAGSQPLVANGLAFDKDGDKLFIADTARGAIWKATFNHGGDLKSKTGCDTTFTPNTLCLDNIFVAHPFLEGADGIALDRDGNIWVDANERQAVVVVTKNGKVIEVFRNPVNSAGLRNSADPVVGNNHILEFPTSPFLTGKLFCTASSDGNRRDNSPRDVGEVDAGAPQDGPIPLGKISCMDQDLKIPGLRLPID
jgi:sugar lactone lactonase YvrE